MLLFEFRFHNFDEFYDLIFSFHAIIMILGWWWEWVDPVDQATDSIVRKRYAIPTYTRVDVGIQTTKICSSTGKNVE